MNQTLEAFSHPTPRHAYTLDARYVYAIQQVVLGTVQDYWDTFHRPLNIHVINRETIRRIAERKAWGGWNFPQVPNHDTVARRVNELADVRLDWGEFGGVAPLLSLGEALYIPNPVDTSLLPIEVREKLDSASSAQPQDQDL
jgi:hypothetical protein